MGQSVGQHYRINSTNDAAASVLVQMSTESAQTTWMHCYNLKNLQTLIVGRLTSVAALALIINLEDLVVNRACE